MCTMSLEHLIVSESKVVLKKQDKHMRKGGGMSEGHQEPDRKLALDGQHWNNLSNKMTEVPSIELYPNYTYPCVCTDE